MESLPHLPEELAILILERLPPASALRLQIVCKLWRCIISAPGFLERRILSYKRREASLVIAEARRDNSSVFMEPSYTVLESPTSPSPTEFRLLPPRPNIDFWSDFVVVVGSCRGVVCLSYLDYGRCVLWNPTTGVSRALPYSNHLIVNARLYNLGFGHYDEDFRVVKITEGWNSPYKPIHIRAQVYELSLDSWREISPTGIDSDDIRLQSYNDRYMACWRDGKMCSWIACNRMVGLENHTRDFIIVSFDMANETFTNFRSALVPFSRDGVGLLALNDLLALWCCNRPHQHSWARMGIWVLLQHGVAESWTKFWTIRVGPEPHWPLEIWNGGLVMTKENDDHLLWCDLSNSPQIIQALPVLAFSRLLWRGT